MGAAVPVHTADAADVLRPLPRRALAAAPPFVPPTAPPFRPTALHAGFLATLRRGLRWMQVVGALVLGDVADALLGRHSLSRSAERLHRVLQSAGGTFSKVGQQVSVRADLLPPEYCHALAKLLDSAPPMAFAVAEAAIVRATGKPLAETFSAFDPQPIGSASIACVYQAVLLSGEKVAVKVRRPGVAALFAADLRVLGWIVSVAEMLAISRPGYAQNLEGELRATFVEELDFRSEAMYQAVFRREARRGRFVRKGRVTAPRVFPDLCSSEVLVQELVTGMWMWELLAAVEQKDPTALQRMQELQIDPRLVGQRMQRASLWAESICPIYHADPHPANILVRERNELVFVDFGSCGYTSRTKRTILWDILEAQLGHDVPGLVQGMLAIMQPLPPIDVPEFERRLEAALRQVSYRIWSQDAPWYERTSAARLYRFLDVAREYDLPIDMDSLRSLRAGMLYDTLALRIDPTLDIPHEGKRFARALARDHARKARRLQRRQGAARRELRHVIENLAELSSSGPSVARRRLERRPHRLSPLVERSATATVEIARLGMAVAVVGALFATACGGVDAAAHSPGFWTAVLVLAAVSARRLQVRIRGRRA